LHKLDPELSLRDVMRVLPHWPPRPLPGARAQVLNVDACSARSRRARQRRRLADRPARNWLLTRSDTSDIAIFAF
jgi:hypothetical protein